MNYVLVLNAGYEPLHHVSVKHAIRMLVRGVAVIEESYEGSRIGPYPVPKVLRLVKYVMLKFRARTPKWSKERLLERDMHVCAYCGSPARTVDHVVPKSKGGATSWLNTVAACRPCNNKKASRLLSDAHMNLRFAPFVPSWWQLSTSKYSRVNK